MVFRLYSADHVSVLPSFIINVACISGDDYGPIRLSNDHFEVAICLYAL